MVGVGSLISNRVERRAAVTTFVCETVWSKLWIASVWLLACILFATSVLWQHQQTLLCVSAGSCCYCVSCTLTFSPNLLAALPHFITQQYGLSLIITYWFFIIINAVRVVYKASFEWAAEAQLHGTNARCLWFEQGQRNQSPLIGDLQRETRIVHRRSRQSTQSGDFPLTCVHAASVHSLKTTR